MKLFNIDAEGNASCKPLDFAGVVTGRKKTIKCAELLKNYAPDKRKVEVAAYPQDGPRNNMVWKQHQAKCTVALGLQVLHKKYGDPNGMCRFTPKSACAGEKFQAGALALVPVTTKISIAEDGTLSPFVCRPIDGMNLELNALVSLDFPIPVWYAIPSSDRSEVNMEIVFEKVDVGMGPSDDKDWSHQTTVEIPILVNPKVIQKGTELTYFKNAGVSKKRAFDII